MAVGHVHRIDVRAKPGPTAEERRLCHEVERFLGIRLDALSIVQCYYLHQDLNQQQLSSLAQAALSDPIVEQAYIDTDACSDSAWMIEIAPKSGVTDNLASTARTACEDCLGIHFSGQTPVTTSRRYYLNGELDQEAVQSIASGWLGNTLIEDIRCLRLERDRTAIEYIPLPDSDEALVSISNQRQLALNLKEMHAIRSHYKNPEVRIARAKQGLSHDPTDAEMEVLAQTWSEHCKHKIFNAKIDYRENGKTETVRSIFKSYIQDSTSQIAENLDWIVSVFSDNAGVVKLDEQWNLNFKVETHNSPSALDPYGGALTGILGVNRDSMGTGNGARLVANTDVFCFAPPDYKGKLPPRLQHPLRVLRGVRRGVEHGGNKSGIPTVNGSLVFDEHFLGKPLVYCGTVGIMPAQINGKATHEKNIVPGDLVVLAGGRTGRDGIHGATFSSEALHEESPSSAVQIGDPFTQKKLHDFLLKARDLDLYRTLTDNGAGGLSSSVGEMAELSNGARLELADVPLKAGDLRPWEILLSESQERMTLAVPPEKFTDLQELAKEFAVEIASIGSFTNSGNFEVYFENKPLVFLSLDFMHDGLPQLELEAEWTAPAIKQFKGSSPVNVQDSLIKLLKRPNICSKEGIVRQYDHEVQASTVIKPLCGAQQDGPSNAGVIHPLELQASGSNAGFAVGHGICPRFSQFDGYLMAANALDEALRNVVAVGGDPSQTAILDNFCWPDPIFDPELNPDGKRKLAHLVRSCRALYDYSIELGTPLISGKDSMKNDYRMGGVKISVPPTLLVSSLAKVHDVTRAVTMDVKRPGDRVYIVGSTKDELGGSEYLASLGLQDQGTPPEVNMKQAKTTFAALHQAISLGLVASCHDCSDGGLLVALAESAFAGDLGMQIEFAKVPSANITTDEVLAFSESASRFVVTVSPQDEEAFSQLMNETPCAAIGVVCEKETLTVRGLNGELLMEESLQHLKTEWKSVPELGACNDVY